MADSKHPTAKTIKGAALETGFYTMDGQAYVVVVVPIDHDTAKEITAKGNTTIGNVREDIAGSNGKVYTFSGMCYRHDRKK